MIVRVCIALGSSNYDCASLYCPWWISLIVFYLWVLPVTGVLLIFCSLHCLYKRAAFWCILFLLSDNIQFQQVMSPARCFPKNTISTTTFLLPKAIQQPSLFIHLSFTSTKKMTNANTFTSKFCGAIGILNSNNYLPFSFTLHHSAWTHRQWGKYFQTCQRSNPTTLPPTVQLGTETCVACFDLWWPGQFLVKTDRKSVV